MDRHHSARHGLIGSAVRCANARTWLVLLAVIVATPAVAQQPEPGFAPLGALCALDATAGSTTEATLLSVALIGRHRVSSLLRPLPAEGTDTTIALAGRLGGASRGRSCNAHWVRPAMLAMYSSSTARSTRDGAIWQGRGATVSLAGGYAMKGGPITVAIRPIAFVSDNRAFLPRPLSAADGDFRDPAWGTGIDLPYRHGDERVYRIDPGESFVRAGWRGLSLAVSTASQHWGPAHHYPLLIGTEGAGYPRGSLEARTVPIGIGTATAQWQVALLEASAYSKLPRGQRSRVSSAVTASFAPKGLDGLEIGAGRFFHVRRHPGTLSWSTATLPFSGILKKSSRDDRTGSFNQLASVFARIAPPLSGLELFGELYREDHNVDIRDLVGEPDHISAYVVGLTRVIARANRLHRFSVEFANARISHLERVRDQSPIYIHGPTAEGHTYRGQPIGTAAMIGGGGVFVSWSRLAATRVDELSYELRRGIQNGEGGTFNGRLNGSHIIRLQRSYSGASSLYSVTAEAELGMGGRASNASVALGWRPECWPIAPCR